MDFKPNVACQKCIGLQLMQGWNKQKIIDWWYDAIHKDWDMKRGDLSKLIEWLNKNLEG